MRISKGGDPLGGLGKEHLVDTQLFLKPRLARWRLGLLGGLFLLVGLILNANAQAPQGMENSRLHTFRPVFAEKRLASASLHAAVRLSGIHKPANINNPTAHGDAHGFSCMGCHSDHWPTEWGRNSTVSLHPAGGLDETGLSLECETCHSKAVAVKG
jgi:hypothetical protein